MTVTSTCKVTTVKSDWFALISAFFYHIILLFGESVLLGGFKFGDEDLDVSGVDTKVSECRYDGYFIFDERHKF